MTTDVVTTSHFDKERTLIGSLTRVISCSEKSLASDFEDSTGSEFAKSSSYKEVPYLSSNSKGDTRSGDDDHQASSDEAVSFEYTPAPKTDDPTLAADEPIWWCVKGQ